MSEFDAQKSAVAMAVIGCQFVAINRADALEFVRRLTALMRQIGEANHVDVSECNEDCAGLSQIVATGYWFDGDRLEALFQTTDFVECWDQLAENDAGIGIFREVFNIPMQRYEVMHSGPDHVVGVGTVRDSVSQPIQRHAYWGSMRDRLPGSADDRFDPTGEAEIVEQSASRVVVRANENLAIIRSGQDLGPAQGAERDEYYKDVEPNLIAGMDYLRDKGGDINCYDCRFMAFLDGDGERTDHTYGYAYFRSLQDLEEWAEHHPTHKAIFGAFQEFAPGYGPDMQSRFWHEVSVLPAANQFAEYINCAPKTGLMNSLS